MPAGGLAVPSAAAGGGAGSGFMILTAGMEAEDGKKRPLGAALVVGVVEVGAAGAAEAREPEPGGGARAGPCACAVVGADVSAAMAVSAVCSQSVA